MSSRRNSSSLRALSSALRGTGLFAHAEIIHVCLDAACDFTNLAAVVDQGRELRRG